MTTAPSASPSTATSADSEDPAAADDPETVCRRVATSRVRPGDEPQKSEISALRGCDSEASYYGIGAPVDFARARKCALLERENKTSPVIGGPAILMMVYANGRGVPADSKLALHFACELDAAPLELSGRVTRLTEGKFAKPFDVCDDITSGYMAGFCAAHEERLAAVARNARKHAAVAGLPAPELAALERASHDYFETRAREEVDLTGTMRGAFSIEEQARLENDYVSALELLRQPSFVPEPADHRALESSLGKVMTRVAACKGLQPREDALAGAVTSAGIHQTQARWLRYRSAFVALAAKTHPGTPRERWQAWLTQSRLKQLEELAGGC